MKTVTTFFIQLLISASLIAQSSGVAFNGNNLLTPQQRTCGTMEADAASRALHPERGNLAGFEVWMAKKITANNFQTKAAIYNIPVIVHVIHNGEAVGTGTNLSAAQVQSQIDVLNEDFQHLNTDASTAPSVFQAVAADVQVQFCLAVVDANGNILAEPGIDRINRTTAGFTAPPYSQATIDGTIKPSTNWDPTRYLNMWALSLGNGLLGYAQFPDQSGLTGLSANGGAANTDGVVILNTSFGRVGNVNYPYNKGRTATHEVGHWLGLRHIWGDQNCGNDFVTDTPTQQASNSGCPIYPSSTCGNSGDMSVNFMDYTDDRCMNMFTAGQKSRIMAVMGNSPRRASLNNSTVCNGSNDDAGIANILSPSSPVCGGSITPSGTLKNFGSAPLTSATITYSIDGVVAGTFNWTGNLAQNATAVVSFNATNVTAGLHTLGMSASNPNGAADGNVANNSTSISFNVLGTPQALPLIEGFENATFPPAGWVIDNPNNNTTWARSATVGNNSSASAWIDIFGSTSIVGQFDAFTTPSLDVSGLANFTIDFDVAYAYYTSPYQFSDTLKVLISTDCGATYTEVYSKFGDTLATAPPIQQAFVPTASQWRTESVNVNLNSNGSVLVKFYLGSDWENNIYLDNINIYTGAPNPCAAVNIIPTITTTYDCVDGLADVSVATTGGATPNYTFGWSNGNTTANVINLTTGNYTVTATDSNGCTGIGSVGVTQTTPIAATTTVVNASCTNGSVTANVTGGDGVYTYLWNDGSTGNAIASAPAGPYSVTVTDGSGCSTTTNVTVNAGNLATLPLVEGFENAIFPPAGWTVNNPDNNVTWARSATVGNNSSASAWVDLFGANNVNGQIDDITTPAIDVSGASNLEITFDVAYAYFTSPYQFSDTLKVFISTDCGVSYTQAYSKWGDTLATRPAIQAAFIPTTSEWRNDTVNVALNTNNSIMVKFQLGNDWENNIYLDNINIAATTPNLCAGISIITAPSTTYDCTDALVDVTLTTAGGAPNYTYDWSTGATGNSQINLSSGSYIVTTTDVNGCTATTNVQVVSGTILSTTAIATDENCNGGNGTATATSTEVNVTYGWSNGNTGATISGLISGIYSVTSTDNNGCTATANATVANIPNTMTVAVASTDENCGSGNGTVTASAPGTGTSYIWSTGGSSATLAGLSAGVYSVTATDNNGCAASGNTTVSNVASTMIAVASSTDENCGGGNGTATASATGTFIDFSWSNGSNGATTTGLSSGIYTVTATDLNGCTATANTTVSNVTSTLVAVASSTNENCGGGNGTAIVTSTGNNVTYLWSNGNAGAVQSGLSQGVFSVTGTDQNGCTATASTTVSDNVSTLVADITVTDEFCGSSNGTVTTYTLGNGMTYLWNNGITTPSITGLVAGAYSVTSTDNKGCTAIANTTVNNVSTTLSTTVTTTDENCGFGNGTASANSSELNVSYVWSAGNTTASITGLSTGTYTVTATDGNGCSSTATANVAISNVSVTIAATATSTDETCGNGLGTASVVSSGSNVIYQWSNGATGPTITGLTAGTYTVTATDGSTCAPANTTTTATIAVVNTASTLVATTNSTNEICGSSNGTVSANAAGPNVTYLWSNGSAGATVSGLSSGNYIVTATDSNGCTASALEVVGSTSSNILAVATSTDENCGAGNGTVAAASTGSNVSYLWGDGTTTASLSNLSAGAYYVTVTDLNGCTASASTTVNNVASTMQAVAISTDENCNNSNGTATATATGSNVSYSWSNGAIGATAFNLPSATYTVTATDINGCTAITTATVNNTASTMVAVATSTGVNCSALDGTATVSATGNSLTYIWSNGGTTATIAGLGTGVYSVTTTDNGGCTATASTTVGTQPSSMSVITTGSDDICGSGSGTALATSAVNNVTYTWSNGASGASLANLNSGTYTVTATDVNGCSATASTFLGNNIITLVVVASTTNDTCGNSVGTAFANSNANTATYAWDNGNSGASISNLSTGIYLVTATDANSCTGTSSVNVGNITNPIQVATVITDENCGNGLGEIIASTNANNVSYLWSNGNTTNTISNLSAAVYTLTVMDGNAGGCSGVENSTVSNNASTINLVTTETNTTCGDMNGSAGASSAVGTVNYTWSNNSTMPTITNLAAGSYIVTATDGAGCSETATVTIASSTSISITSTISDLSCNGNNSGAITLTPSGSTAPYSFNWDNGQNAATQNNLAAGNYTVTATSNDGCEFVNTYAIAEPSAMATTISSASATNTCDGSATITTAGGVAPYTIVWDDSANQTTATASGLCVGTYTASVTDANGCVTTAAVEIKSSISIGIEVVDIANALKIMPNPTNGLFYLKGENINATVTISILNIVGQQVYSTQLPNQSNVNHPIDITNEANGVYFVTIQTKNQSTVKRIVIER